MAGVTVAAMVAVMVATAATINEGSDNAGKGLGKPVTLGARVWPTSVPVCKTAWKRHKCRAPGSASHVDLVRILCAYCSRNFIWPDVSTAAPSAARTRSIAALALSPREIK